MRLLLLLLLPLVHLGHRHPLEQRVGCAHLVFDIDPEVFLYRRATCRLYDRRHSESPAQTDAVCHGCYAFLKESRLDGSSRALRLIREIDYKSVCTRIKAQMSIGTCRLTSVSR